MSSSITADARSEQRYVAIVDELRSLPSECAWAEFKQNNLDPERISRTVSALSNTARLSGKSFAYLVWGIQDQTHDVIGTDFEPDRHRKGSEPFQFWLAKSLEPSPAFTFRAVAHPKGRVVLLEIPAASSAPVQSQGKAYIRIGETTPLLSDFPERERALWNMLQPIMWEEGIAASYLEGDEVLSLIDYPSYFSLLEIRLPDNREGIFQKLVSDNIISSDAGNRWNITNLGALLFANSLESFDRIRRKRVRIIQYSGKTRAADAREHMIENGYARAFSKIIGVLQSILPNNEHIERALRRETSLYPEIALRELLANSLIHQDLTLTGSGPTVEIYDDRIEITNPGKPLVDVGRFIGAPPRSRNEAVAALMRRMNICEERGSGIVRVLYSAELFQLPAPDFRSFGDNFQVAMFSPRNFKDMDASERLRACFQHAALKYVAGEKMTNSTLRQRFGIQDQNAAQVSRIIKDALRDGLIRPADPSSPRAGYVPVGAS